MVRQTHHLEPSRRAISKFEFPMIQTSLEFESLYFEIYLEFEFCYLNFSYLSFVKLFFNHGKALCPILE